MKQKDEALKLALEAMESVTVECNNFHHPKKDQNHHWAKCPPVARWDKAITAIKEALAQEQEPVAWMYQEYRDDDHFGWRDEIQFVQPPNDPNYFREIIPVYTTLLQPEQEPVADDFFRMIADRNPKSFSSLQRTWVGLSEDDKVLINHDANFNQFMTAGEYADRVQQLTEARLKDKNT